MNLTALTKLAVKPAGKLAIESVKFVTGLSALLSPFRLLIVIIFGFFFFIWLFLMVRVLHRANFLISRKRN